eukprot:scaffold16213_cov69-Cylindrotheca_fusiformis.AAC.1
MRKQQNDTARTPTILIACHKAKEPKAKNFRRIKLNLRNELERQEKLNAGGGKNNSSQDWEEILESCIFCSSSVNPPLLEEIQSFCSTGSCSSRSS